MSKIQPKQWRRMNPNYMKETNFRLQKLTFDGDHALLNNFSVRERYTIQDIIDAVADYEQFTQEKVKKEQSIALFKEKAQNEGVFVNLKEVTDKLFFDSEHMDEFWRICFELHQKAEGVKK